MPVGMFFLLAYMVTRWREQRRNWVQLSGNYCYFYCIAVSGDRASRISLDLASDVCFCYSARFTANGLGMGYGFIKGCRTPGGSVDDDSLPGDA